MTLKERIVEAAKKNKGKREHVTAWGVDAFIRIMSGKERDQWEAELCPAAGIVNKAQARARLIVKTLADEDGRRLFDDSEVGAMNDLDGKELDRLFDLASKINGLTKEAVEEEAKNSPPAQTVSSASV